MFLISDALIDDLANSAREVSRAAYCPYSGFAVGAAVLAAETGAIHTGCNVENASYGLGICAERSAILSMVATGSTRLTALVVYSPTRRPTAPCGACRQVINEFAPECRIVCVCDGEERIDTSLDKLLPVPFNATALG